MFAYSVSRSHEEAAKDDEFPGPPVLHLVQTRLWEKTTAQKTDRSISPSLRYPQRPLNTVDHNTSAQKEEERQNKNAVF